MTKAKGVPRPLRKSEYSIQFATNQSRKGWMDLVATQRSAVVEAWEYLARHPDQETPQNHRLRGGLAMVTHQGKSHERWQHELHNGPRVWFYIDGRDVYLIDVHTHHPNETK